MAGVPGLLVVVQHDVFLAVQLSAAVNKHPGFGICRTAILAHFTGCLICLDYRQLTQLCLQPVYKRIQISLCTPDDPVCHSRHRNFHIVTLKLLANPVQRHCIRIFGIHNSCHQRGRGNAVDKQICRAGGTHNFVFFLCGIDRNMVLHNLFGCGMVLQLPVNIIRKPLPATLTKNLLQFFLRKFMVLNPGR